MVLSSIFVLTYLCAAPLAFAKYDQAVTDQMGQAARAAYCGQATCLKQLEKFTCDACTASGFEVDGLETFKTPQNVITPFSSTGQFWYAAKVMNEAYKGACLVSFRGSSNSANWATDFNKDMVSLEQPGSGEDEVKVHKGFYETYLNLEKKLVDYLETNQCSKLLITGHSLGAAQATLASYFLTNGPHLKTKFGLSEPFSIIYSYQFESPRVGNVAFSELYGKHVVDRFQSFRVTYGQDPVVLLPTPAGNVMYDDKGSPVTYQHVGNEVYYGRGGQFTLCSGPKDPKCSVQYQNKSLRRNILDHCVVSWLSTKNVCQCNTCAPADI